MARRRAFLRASESGFGSDLRAAYRSSSVMYSHPDGLGYEVPSSAAGVSVLASDICGRMSLDCKSAKGGGRRLLAVMTR